jgi:hypothetical protein
MPTISGVPLRAEGAATMRCEECDAPLWCAGDEAPPGVYVHVDMPAEHPVILHASERLPASFDGHIAIYRASGCACVGHCRPAGNGESHAAPQDMPILRDAESSNH